MLQDIHPKNFPEGSKRAQAHKALTSHISSLHGISVIALAAILGGGFLFVLAQSIPNPSSSIKKAEVTNLPPKGGIVGKATDHILVKFKENVGNEKKNSILAAYGSSEKKEIDKIKVKLVKVPQGKTPESFIEDLKKNESASIEFAEVDAAVGLAYTPNDPSLGSEWHIAKIQTPLAWDSAKGKDVVVAVLDTGTDCTHPDLTLNCVPGWNVVSNSNDSNDVHNHGTWVAGTVAAIGDNTLGVAGVAYQAKIMPIRITNDPAGYAYWSDVTNGIIYAADHGAKIATNSYASTESSTVQSAANYLRSKGGLFVASAGNDSTLLSTVNSTNVITVGATDSSDYKTSWSNYGPVIDVTAPGASILTTARGGGYQYVSGTSFSAPITAATLALIFSANPNLTPSQAENILFSTAKDLDGAGWDQYYGWGRVDASAAVNAALATQGTQDTLAPSVPANLTASNVTSSQATLSWAASTDNLGVTGYEIFKNTVKIATVPGTTYTDKTLSASTNYSYTVRATDAAGNTSIMSNNTSVTTPAAPIATLSISSNTVASKTATSATIKWSTTIPATSVITYGKSQTSLTGTQSVTQASTNAQVTLSALTAKTTYYYQITVTGADGTVQKSSIASFVTKPK